MADKNKMSFEQMKKLHKDLNRKGYNICIGCPFEDAATCLSDRVDYCNKQLSLYHQNPEKYKDIDLKFFIERLDYKED